MSEASAGGYTATVQWFNTRGILVDSAQTYTAEADAAFRAVIATWAARPGVETRIHIKPGRPMS